MAALLVSFQQEVEHKWLKGTEKKKMLCETSLFLFQNFNVADFKAPKSNA